MDEIPRNGERYESWTSAEEKASAKAAELATLPPGEDMWVFGYGSLLWRPGFDFIDSRPARLHGYHRQFCVYSHYYRGTEARPGLVLGLDRGGACLGRVFRVPADRAASVLGYLWDREMIYRVYVPKTLTAESDGRRLSCRTFVADRKHVQYAGRVSLEKTAEMIGRASGKAGANAEYLHSLVEHLQELGLRAGRLRARARGVRDGEAAA